MKKLLTLGLIAGTSATLLAGCGKTDTGSIDLTKYEELLVD